MKHYTQRSVEGMLKDLGKINARVKPHPFPGKSPTRVFMAFRDGKKQLKYLGKPNGALLSKIIRLHNGVGAPNRYLMLIEFDRGGLLTFSKAQHGKAAVNVKNAKLYAHYHPGLFMDFWPLWMRYKYETVDHTYKVI